MKERQAFKIHLSRLTDLLRAKNGLSVVAGVGTLTPTIDVGPKHIE